MNWILGKTSKEQVAKAQLHYAGWLDKVNKLTGQRTYLKGLN